MDQVKFENLIKKFAAEYYAAPRSTRIPTPYGPFDLSKIEQPPNGLDKRTLWLLEDFADFLNTGDRERR